MQVGWFQMGFMNLLAPFIPVSEICLDRGLKQNLADNTIFTLRFSGETDFFPFLLSPLSCSIRKERKEQGRKDKGWKTGREGETRAEAGKEGKRARGGGGGGGRMGVKKKQVWAVLSGPVQCVLIFSCWFSLYSSCRLLHRTAGSSHLLSSFKQF